MIDDIAGRCEDAAIIISYLSRVIIWELPSTRVEQSKRCLVKPSKIFEQCRNAVRQPFD